MAVYDRQIRVADVAEKLMVALKECNKRASTIDVNPTGANLFPGRPEICQGNGEHPDYEICCDSCNY